MSIVIITGASRGIGAAIARESARRGQGVILTYKSHPAGADAVVRAIEAEGGRAVALALDVGLVASFTAFRASVEAALRDTWGVDRFDGLVNNAGHGLFNPIATVTEAEFDGLMNVHLKGPFFLTQALLPSMADGASIVNLTSATTRVATPGVAPYAAFKGGLAVLTRYMAKEFGARRIRANSVSPGAIRTDMTNAALEQAPAWAEALAEQTALGRLGEPEDVARVVAALLSPDTGWVNAQDIEVAGGFNV